MSDDKALRDLISKGDGVLSRRGGVWTYAGCPNDTSGTNLVLPVEYVSDTAVQKALADGTLSAAVMAPTGFVSAVRLTEDGNRVVTAGLTGSPEMGTELPVGSRVESDAGARVVPAEVAERQAVDSINALRTPVAVPAWVAPVKPIETVADAKARR